MANKSFIDFFKTKKKNSGVILSGIYSRMFTRIDSKFRAGACKYLMFILIFWLTYTNVCRANAMLKQLRGMRRFNKKKKVVIRYIFAPYSLTKNEEENIIINKIWL